jgi:hypothetical protein
MRLPVQSATSTLMSNSGVVFGFAFEKDSHFGFVHPTTVGSFDLRMMDPQRQR